MNLDRVLDVVEYGLWVVGVTCIFLGVHIFLLVRAQLRQQRETKMVNYDDPKWWP